MCAHMIGQWQASSNVHTAAWEACPAGQHAPLPCCKTPACAAICQLQQQEEQPRQQQPQPLTCLQQRRRGTRLPPLASCLAGRHPAAAAAAHWAGRAPMPRCCGVAGLVAGMEGEVRGMARRGKWHGVSRPWHGTARLAWR